MSKKSGILALFSLLLYSNTVFNGFISDDHALLRDRNLTPASFSEFFSRDYWARIPAEARGRLRPLRSLSLLADKGLYGDSAAGYHLTNAGLNACAVLAAGSLGAVLFKNPEVGFMGALFFAAHPAKAEAVAWVKNRSDILCSLFYFLALIALMRFGGGGGAPAAAAASLAACLALLSKETALTLPIAGGVVSMFFLEGDGRRRGLFLCAWLLFLSLSWFFFKELVWAGDISSSVPVDAYMQLRMVLLSFAKYVSLLFFPIGLSVEHEFSPMGSGLLPASPALFIFLALLLWAWRRKDKEAGFSLLWMLVTLLPVLNFVFLESRPIAEQRLYLPAAGVSWLLAVVFVRTKARRPAYGAFLALLALFSAATFSRNFVWKDDLSLWKDAVEKNPSNYRANYNLGVQYQGLGLYAEAIRAYSAASADADLPEIYYALAFCYDKVGDYDKAMQNYGLALKLAEKPPPDLFNNMGIVCEKSGDTARAGEYYEKALSVSPDYWPARKNLERLGKRWKKK